MGGHCHHEDRSTADRRIAIELLAGEKQALRCLVQRYAPPLVAVAQRITLDRSIAEDVVQDVFVGLWRRPDTYDPERASMATWLHIRCRTAAIDTVRSRSSRERREQLAATVHSRGYGDQYQIADTVLVVGTALATLSLTDRELIGLTFFAGLSYRAAAQSLGIPEGTAKSSIRRILEHLRQQLSETASP